MRQSACHCAPARKLPAARHVLRDKAGGKWISSHSDRSAPRDPILDAKIRGIGPVYAKKLVRVFGEKVFDVIEAEPGRLHEVDGTSAGRRQRL